MQIILEIANIREAAEFIIDHLDSPQSPLLTPVAENRINFEIFRWDPRIHDMITKYYVLYNANVTREELVTSLVECSS